MPSPDRAEKTVSWQRMAHSKTLTVTGAFFVTQYGMIVKAVSTWSCILNERYRIDEDEPDGLQPVPSPGQQLHESAEFLGFLDADK
ncbi:hypothetical protein KXV78_008134 [Aspergillus fumigatus]|nr:hypothetical protein KXV78_008134 [Aspergillus fumigatus]